MRKKSKVTATATSTATSPATLFSNASIFLYVNGNLAAADFFEELLVNFSPDLSICYLVRLGKLNIEVLEGQADGVTFTGSFETRQTVLLRLGQHSISKRAFQLGAILACCQIFDGLLTWLGINLYGVKMEGNAFLQALMQAYGAAPTIFAAKLLAVALVVFLSWYAHSRRWIRPLILALCVIYVLFAIWPWAYIVSNHYANTPGNPVNSAPE